MNIFPATKQVFSEIKGMKFVPHNGEGVVYVKLVALKPQTIETGDPAKTTNDAQGVIVCGRLDEIKQKFNEWFDALSEEYQK